MTASVDLSPLERRLANEFQRDFPLTPRPYLTVAHALGIGEDRVLAMLKRLQENGVLSRVGAVVRPNTAGASTLAAMAVPPEHLEAAAEVVSARPEVNHNYERDHHYNLWFVVTAADEDHKQRVLDEIAAETNYPVMDLPLEAEYHIDLGFELSWD
jgi:DNA-binding Lrp family transcriptional regulator